MADVSDYIYMALHDDNYNKVFANLYEILTDEELYEEERGIVYDVIGYMKRVGFDRENIARRLDDLFGECAEFCVVESDFKRTVYDYLNGEVFI